MDYSEMINVNIGHKRDEKLKSVVTLTIQDEGGNEITKISFTPFIARKYAKILLEHSLKADLEK